jgi:hypothetical protein
MNALPASAIFAPTEVALEAYHYLDWKLELSQYWMQSSWVYNWKVIDNNDICRESGSFSGELSDLQLEFRRKVDGSKLMTCLTTNWVFSPSPKTVTAEDFKDNQQAWRDRCRLLHLVRELEKMKQANPNLGFQQGMEETIAGMKKAIATLDAEVSVPVAQPVKGSKKTRN